MFHAANLSGFKASFQKSSKSTGSGRSSSPGLFNKLSSSLGRRSPEPAAQPQTGATICPPPPPTQLPEIASPFAFEAQSDCLESELLMFLTAIGTGDNPAAFQDGCELSIDKEIKAVQNLSQDTASQQHQVPPPMVSESTAMVEDRPRSAIRPIPRRARAAALASSVPAPSPFAFNDIPDYRRDIVYRRPVTPPPDAEIEFMPGAELRHERNVMETKDLIEREKAKIAGKSTNSQLFIPDLYSRLEEGTREATAITKVRASVLPVRGDKKSPPTSHSPAPAPAGGPLSPASSSTTPLSPAKGGDLADVAQDLSRRETALAAFAAMRIGKDKTKFSTRIANTKAPVFQFSEDRSTSGIFRSSNPISARPKVVPMDEDKGKVAQTKAADAAMDSAPTGVEVPPPPVKDAEMDLGGTVIESSEPAHVAAPDIPTPAIIEAIVMAEATSAVGDLSAPVMDLEAPISITVVEPEPSSFPQLPDISDLYAGYDLPIPFSPPVFAGHEDIFDLGFPEAQFGGDLPSLAPPIPPVSVPDVSPTPAADFSACAAADDEAMLVDDEWAMDGVWPSGVAEPYTYSEFDIVVDTPADMAAAERDRLAWEKKCRASEPVVEAIEAEEDEIPGLNLPPPTFRCSSFEWKNLDLGLPGTSYSSPPSPGSDSDSDSGPPTPKDVYDPYDPDYIALYGGFDDGLNKVSPLFEDPFSTEKVDALLEYLIGDMDLGGPSPSLVDRKSDVKTSTQKRYSPYAGRRPAAADFF